VDLLLTGTRIHDGNGGSAFPGGVLVRDARIREVFRGGVPDEVHADELVDVADHVICPGFVDLHTHSDVSVLSEPGCVSAVGQGITTQLVGHCGFSAAPVTASTVTDMAREEPVFGFPGVEWSWRDLDGYLAAVRARQPATNILSLVGHNTVRRLVVGGAARTARDDETRKMAAHVDATLDAGAVGLSTGLSYAPGLYADESELHELARVAQRRGRRYHTHMRYGGMPIRVALAEAIRVAEATGVGVNVSHLYPSPADSPGEAEQLLNDIDGARARGLDVTFDLTVFCRGGGAWLQALPGWARSGGVAATVERLADRRERGRMLADLDNRGIDWDDQLIVKIADSKNVAVIGRSIGAVARDRGERPSETALQLVAEDGQFWVAPHVKRQPDLDLLITHPCCVPVTDGMAAHPVAHRDLGIMPKTFGTMPMVLGSYVRDRGVLRLEDAIHKLTRLAADRAGLIDRGLLAPGYAADVVVFDPGRIANNATDDDPTAPPTGVEHVMVNGRWAVRHGSLTGDRPGQVLAA
jgi:N-acyl-D-aspartate/D-glutamate deacylase